MKLPMKSILFTGILAISANTVLVAQTSNPWFEGWYRAKFGRPSPTEQERIQVTPATEPAGALQTGDITGSLSAPVNTWFEQWYRDKYGRPSPTEEARIQAQLANVPPRAKSASNTTQTTLPANTWFENWYRDKYGRPSPQETARQNAQSR